METTNQPKSVDTKLAGIQMVAMPMGQTDAGLFNLPPGFDSRKFAASWVKEGTAVEMARQREPIMGTNLTADGWEIYKDATGKPVKVTTGKSGVYVLMKRPKAVQANVNAIYGNVGKHYAKAEQTQAAATLAENGQDPGMLPTQVLDQLRVRDNEFAPDPTDNHFAENPVAGVGGGNVSTEPLRT